MYKKIQGLFTLIYRMYTLAEKFPPRFKDAKCSNAAANRDIGEEKCENFAGEYGTN